MYYVGIKALINEPCPAQKLKESKKRGRWKWWKGEIYNDQFQTF
jgi:hypothetical protein